MWKYNKWNRRQQILDCALWNKYSNGNINVLTYIRIYNSIVRLHEALCMKVLLCKVFFLISYGRFQYTIKLNILNTFHAPLCLFHVFVIRKHDYNNHNTKWQPKVSSKNNINSYECHRRNERTFLHMQFSGRWTRFCSLIVSIILTISMDEYSYKMEQQQPKQQNNIFLGSNIDIVSG